MFNQFSDIHMMFCSANPEYDLVKYCTIIAIMTLFFGKATTTSMVAVMKIAQLLNTQTRQDMVESHRRRSVGRELSRARDEILGDLDMG